MIVGSGTRGGRRWLLLGLTRENVERLKAGQPIGVPRESLDRCDFNGLSVGIVYGDTLADVQAQLEGGRDKADG